MSSQAFFWVNVGLGLFLILIFLFGKKGAMMPSRLNLRRRSSSATAPAIVTRSVETVKPVKDLNVIFLYNGHNFDAYEVFGLPAAASFELVQQHYQAALKRKGHDRLFLEAAFSAIQDLKNSKN
ncbi:MAG: hypothetical protein ACXWC9_05465 [Pseudobdellovibrionaceae bacterium]